MQRYITILLIFLIGGGCIYGTGLSELGYRSRTNIGSSGIEKSDQAYKPKQFKTNQRKGFTISSISRPKPQGSKEQLDSRGNLRIRSRNSSSNVKYTTFLVTAYTKNDKGMNGKGKTSRGTYVRKRYTAANDKLPFGTKIYFKELNLILVVEDRFTKDRTKPLYRLDMYIPTKKEANLWGKRKLKGVVLK